MVVDAPNFLVEVQWVPADGTGQPIPAPVVDALAVVRVSARRRPHLLPLLELNQTERARIPRPHQLFLLVGQSIRQEVAALGTVESHRHEHLHRVQTVLVLLVLWVVVIELFGVGGTAIVTETSLVVLPELGSQSVVEVGSVPASEVVDEGGQYDQEEAGREEDDETGVGVVLDVGLVTHLHCDNLRD